MSNATFWKCEVYVEMLNGFHEGNASEFVFFELLANDALTVLLFRDLVIFD